MNLNTVQGQNLPIRMLQADIKQASFSGAYLFAGPQGTGKRMTAVCFAKAINCKENTLTGCEKCSACLKIERGTHPNLGIITPDGESIKIDQIRNLKIESAYKIYEGKKRVWIIDEAEKLTTAAANSLLKIMEEPPSDLILILVTHVPSMLPATIISRCRVINFSSLTRSQIELILREKTQLSDSLIFLTSKLAQGSAGEALKFAQNKEILQEREAIFNLISRGKSLSNQAFELAQRWGDKKYMDKKYLDIDLLLNMVLFFLRDILMLKIGASTLIFNQDKRQDLLNVKNSYSFSALYKAIAAVEESKLFIKANVSAKFVFEAMWMKIIHLG